MQDGLMAQAAETGVAMDDVNLLTNDNVAEDGEEGEDGREGRLAINNKEGHMVDLETIGQIADSSATLVLMGDDDDLVASVNELLRQLVDVTFDSSGLREEEVADHGDVVRHDGNRKRTDAAERLAAWLVLRAVGHVGDQLSSDDGDNQAGHLEQLPRSGSATEGTFENREWAEWPELTRSACRFGLGRSAEPGGEGESSSFSSLWINSRK